MTTAIEALRNPQQTQGLSAVSTGHMFSSIQAFENGQRMAKALVSSSLFPQQYKEIGDAMIVLEMSQRLGMSPLIVAQNLDVIHGRPSWRAQFAIASVNQSGRFAEPMDFEFVGTKGNDDWGCRAVATTTSGKVIEGPLIDIAMAKAEGWYGKKGSKWQTMPEQMLRYRAAAFFARTTCPELLLGLRTVDENRDIIDIDPQTGTVIDAMPTGPVDIQTKRQEVAPSTSPDDEAEDAEIVDPDDFPKQLPDGKWIDVTGEVWNTDLHATSGEGGPIGNKDGSFRKKRGTADAPPAQPEPPAAAAPAPAAPATDTPPPPQQQAAPDPAPTSGHPNAPGGDNSPPPSDDYTF